MHTYLFVDMPKMSSSRAMYGHVFRSCDTNREIVAKGKSLQKQAQPQASVETYDKNDVNRQYEIFLAKHPDGKVTSKNFRRVMRACFPDLDTTKLESNFFRMCDTNGDGHIDFKEFMEFMIVLYQMSNGCLYSQKGTE